MELLDLMLGDMELADPLYRPTKFWEIGLPSLIKDLRSNGFENFRSHDSADFFHVPIYSERLKDNHFKQLYSYLESDYPVGKKINFLVQEIGREINTIGSKSHQADVTIDVVEVKDELEKIREQIQNIL